MNTTFEAAEQNAEIIRQLAASQETFGVYNATHGLRTDIRECVICLRDYKATEPVQLLREEWDAFFSVADPEGLLLVICNSQGTILVRNALISYDEELRQRIVVLAVAPAAYIDDGLCRSVRHLVSDWDLITWIDWRGRLRCQGSIVHVKRGPGAHWFMDHAFRSSSYQDHIEAWLQYWVRYCDRLGVL